MRALISGLAAATATFIFGLPQVTAKPAPFRPRSSLSRAQITAGINTVRRRVGACRRLVAVHAKVTVRVKVAPTGVVLRARVSPSSPYPRLDACVEAALAQARFSRSSGVSRFTYPFIFRGPGARMRRPPPRRFSDRPSRGDVRRGIASVRARLDRCSRRHVPSGSKMTVRARFRIKPSGTVRHAWVRGGRWRLRRCVKRAIESINFPATRFGMFVRRPIRLDNIPPPPRYRSCRRNWDCGRGNFCRGDGNGNRICMHPMQ